MAHSSLKVFDGLPLKERLFVRGRLATAPLEALAARAEGARLLDVGCGHGVLVALLAVGSPGRHVVGIDPDERKIDWARASVGRLANVELRACTIETLAAERAGEFDTVLVADVLYLLAAAAWRPFLAAAHELLRRGGRLVLKEAEDDGSWRVKESAVSRAIDGPYAAANYTRAARSVSRRARRSRRQCAPRASPSRRSCRSRAAIRRHIS